MQVKENLNEEKKNWPCMRNCLSTLTTLKAVIHLGCNSFNGGCNNVRQRNATEFNMELHGMLNEFCGLQCLITTRPSSRPEAQPSLPSFPQRNKDTMLPHALFHLPFHFIYFYFNCLSLLPGTA